MATFQDMLPLDALTMLSRETRRCVECNQIKPIQTFSPKLTRSGRTRSNRRCLACRNAKQRASTLEQTRRLRHERMRDGRPHASATEGFCTKCGTTKSANGFYRNITNKTGLSDSCILCTKIINKASRAKRRSFLKETNPKKVWADQVMGVRRESARKAGVSFSIKADDLVSMATDTCPILGFDLDYRGGHGKAVPASPSVDRFHPEDGYVTGNILVVSYKANTMKSNGTPQEHAKLVAWYLSHPDLTSAEKVEVVTILRAAMEAANRPTLPHSTSIDAIESRPLY